MTHLAVVPVVLPMLAGALALLAGSQRLVLHRAIGIVATLAQLAVACVLLVTAAEGTLVVYPLGDWPAPFGIVLVVDRLAALMLVLVALLAAVSLWHAIGGWDARGRHFHALFQFQLMGLAGAFLTGDLFNLFVFFEVLLIASYCLLLHGQGRARAAAAIHYVVLNLVASALFLIAASLIYAVTGTLNMADLGQRVAALAPAEAVFARSAGLILFVVFATKAAIVPLHFWLPATYTSASAPVAALFAIMTKVGVYAIVRVYTLVFGALGADGATAPGDGLIDAWLLPLAIVTGVLAALGALAARDFRVLVAYLTVQSIGTLLAGLAAGTADALAASIYYLAHSTLVGASLFLLAEAIGASRGAHDTRLEPRVPIAQPWLLGGLVLVQCASIIGLPPFSGFVGKLLVLDGAYGSAHAAAIWALVLGTGVLTLTACARAGSVLFWHTAEPAAARSATKARKPDGARGRAAAAASRQQVSAHARDAGGDPPVALAPAVVLVALGVLLAVAAGPAKHFADATARQLLDRERYVAATLGALGRDGASRPLKEHRQ